MTLEEALDAAVRSHIRAHQDHMREHLGDDADLPDIPPINLLAVAFGEAISGMIRYRDDHDYDKMHRCLDWAHAFRIKLLQSMADSDPDFQQLASEHIERLRRAADHELESRPARMTISGQALSAEEIAELTGDDEG